MCGVLHGPTVSRAHAVDPCVEDPDRYDDRQARMSFRDSVFRIGTCSVRRDQASAGCLCLLRPAAEPRLAVTREPQAFGKVRNPSSTRHGSFDHKARNGAADREPQATHTHLRHPDGETSTGRRRPAAPRQALLHPKLLRCLRSQSLRGFGSGDQRCPSAVSDDLR